MEKDTQTTMTPEELQYRYGNSRKNRYCLQEIMRRTLYAMEGYGASFEQQVTNRKNRFDHAKALDFIDGLIGRWETQLCLGAAQDPDAKQSAVAPYVGARKSLYRNWLYIAIRCSLIRNGYGAATGTDIREQPTFRFLMDRAEALVRSCCVMAWPDRSVANAPFLGFSNCFGLHFYLPLSGLSAIGPAPVDCPACITGTGSIKPHMLGDAYGDVEPSEDAGTDEDYGDEEDDFRPEDEFLGDDAEHMSQLECLCATFVDKDGYLQRCDRFMELFRCANPDVMHTFRDDLAEIFSLYLTERGACPMSDTDAALDVYSRIYDNAYHAAGRYEKRAVNG